jgi:hypothetical protein
MDAALDAENSAPLHRSMLHGALGSYQFYDHVVSRPVGLDIAFFRITILQCSRVD